MHKDIAIGLEAGGFKGCRGSRTRYLHMGQHSESEPSPSSANNVCATSFSPVNRSVSHNAAARYIL